MNPVLIYFRERPFKQNKFVLDFSDSEQHVRSIEFEKNKPYFIVTLNCKLQLEKIVHGHTKESKEAITKLSEKSRILLRNGSDHFCDIDSINLTYSPKYKTYEIVDARQNFYFERTPKNLKNYSYKYKFWDEKEKKLRDAEIYSPYTQLSTKGLSFKQKVTNIEFVTKIDKELEELHSYFYTKNVRSLTYKIGLEWYRDINLFFAFDDRVPRRATTQKWYTTNIDFFDEAICAEATDRNFNEANFAEKYYSDDGKGDRVIGRFDQRLRLGSKKYLMPITYVLGNGNLRLIPNEPFFVSDMMEYRLKTFLKDSNIKDLGEYVLTDDDLEELRKLIPNFKFHQLRKFACTKFARNVWQNELIYYPVTRYQSFGQPAYTSSLMLARADKNSFKYRRYLNSDRNIFHMPYFRKLPSTLAAAELLFDKDVLEVKDLVKKTSSFVNEVTDEQKNFVLYDNSNLIKETFFTKIKKNIASYGMISTHYKRKGHELITWENRLEFIAKNNIKKQSLTLQLEDATEPKPIATEDSKMSNITILKVDELPKKKIVGNFFIQGLQKFEKFKTLNPLNIQVIDTKIREEISLYARSNYRYIFRFIANVLLFSSNFTEDTNCIFIVADDLVDAKSIFINEKFFQAIGTIYTSEIENWSDIKKGSDWVNVKLTDIAIPIAAKHFAFGFETQDFNNLLNFKYSLLNDKGELIKFKDEETKVPSLNFSIQILK